MAITISDAAQNAACDAVVNLVDVGAADATLEYRTGAKPADVDDADAGTLLCTFDLAATAFGDAGGAPSSTVGVADLLGTLPLETAAVATGTVAHARLKDADGAAVIDFTVTATGGGGDIEVTNTSIADTQTVQLSSLTITMPAAAA